MLTSKRRLRAAEVRQIIKEGRARRAGHLSMKYSKTAEPLRSAAVVSKSVAKTAVVRNRLRRALYRALKGSTETGCAVIFIQKIPKEALEPAFAQDLAQLFA